MNHLWVHTGNCDVQQCISNVNSVLCFWHHVFSKGHIQTLYFFSYTSESIQQVFSCCTYCYMQLIILTCDCKTVARKLCVVNVFVRKNADCQRAAFVGLRARHRKAHNAINDKHTTTTTNLCRLHMFFSFSKHKVEHALYFGH